MTKRVLAFFVFCTLVGCSVTGDDQSEEDVAEALIGRLEDKKSDLLP